MTRKKILAPSFAEPVEAAFTPSPKTYNPLPFIFFVPLWSFILLLSPSWRDLLLMSPSWRGLLFCPPHRGGAGGGDSDCSGSNPYNNHLRHFVTPPPAEDIWKERRTSTSSATTLLPARVSAEDIKGCRSHGWLSFFHVLLRRDYLFCPPHGGGAGGGFGLLGEQSLQQPPPSLRDTSA